MASSSNPFHACQTIRPTGKVCVGGKDWWVYDPDADGGDIAEIKVHFDVELFAPSPLSLELPFTSEITGRSRWVSVVTVSGFTFKIFLRENRGRYEFRRGWSILVASECLKDEQVIRFEMVSQSTFKMLLVDRHVVPAPFGFSTARPASGNVTWTGNDYIVSRGTQITPPVWRAMHVCWAASGAPSKMYVCTIVKSQVSAGTMFFSTEYSSSLPKKKQTVALRFVGSPVIIPGSVRRQANGIAMVSRGWPLFKEEHQICAGEVFIFIIHRGPSAWEMLACRSGVIV